MGLVHLENLVVGLENRVEAIVREDYAELNENIWWDVIAKTRETVTAKEILTWIVETAMIRKLDPGSMYFEDLEMAYREIAPEFAGAGFQITREQAEDVVGGTPGGAALAAAASWAKQIAEHSRYWPQHLAAERINAGENADAKSYDGVPFFSDVHPVNGKNTEAGTFANLITGAVLSAANLGAGAARIDESVTVEEAVTNLQRVMAYLMTIKQANGKNPRRLRAKAIIVPPALAGRAGQLTNAHTVAQAATSGGGSANIESVVRRWNLGQPYVAEELGSAYGGEDNAYYIVAGPRRAEADALLYVNREPFEVLFHGPAGAAELARTRKLQWVTGGRNAMTYGHPFQLFKVKAS